MSAPCPLPTAPPSSPRSVKLTLENTLVVYYDTETTGKYPQDDEIVELAARVKPTSVLPETVNDRFASLVRPKRGFIPQAVVKIHGIQFEDVKDSEEFPAVAHRFFHWLESIRAKHDHIILVAHNNFTFDQVIFVRQCKENNIDLPAYVTFGDSLPIFRDVFRSAACRSNELASLAQRYHVEQSKQDHRAASDVDLLIAVVERCPDTAVFYELLLQMVA